MREFADVFIIGGGINGVGIAADAAGRGLSVILVEQNDLGSGTSSASTKLIHGGLRYLEHYEFFLVRKALREREILLNAAPHIIRPMRFLLPLHKGLRPAWLIRLGLFIYDHMGGREILPPTSKVDLTTDDYAGILRSKYKKAYEYSDCWVDDARLVVLNACVARDKGAEILPRHKAVSVTRSDNQWHIDVKNMMTGEIQQIAAKAVVNAAGPWVDKVMTEVLGRSSSDMIRLVKGSHIIVPEIFQHDRAYLFQASDGRIIFAIPFEDEFTLIGTTDRDYDGDLENVQISDGEIFYLCEMASAYFKKRITPDQVVADYAGVRPLYNDGVSPAQEATRDFVLDLDKRRALLNVIGGKITTYRVLAQRVLRQLNRYFPHMKEQWTADNPLPGGDFKYENFDQELKKLAKDYSFLGVKTVYRLFRAYGTNARVLLDSAEGYEDLGIDFGAGLYQREVEYLIKNEWAVTAEDILWRRSKLGYHMTDDQKNRLTSWMADHA